MEACPDALLGSVQVHHALALWHANIISSLTYATYSPSTEATCSVYIELQYEMTTRHALYMFSEPFSQSPPFFDVSGYIRRPSVKSSSADCLQIMHGIIHAHSRLP